MFVYDDKVILSFNYSDDSRTITLHEIDGGLGHSIRIPRAFVHQKKRGHIVSSLFLVPTGIEEGGLGTANASSSPFVT